MATFKHRLKQHKDKNHKGIRYPCDQCDYVGTCKEVLNNHVRGKHEGGGHRWWMNINGIVAIL